MISYTASNKSTKYKCRCPCLRDGNSCKAICKCKGCKNPNGARMVLSPTASRKRNYSKLQCVDIPSSKRFALDRQEQLQTGKWTVLETFVLGQILKLATSTQEVLPLFNAVAKEAECTLKDTSLQDALCARSVHSLAAKIQSMQAAETIAAINLYWCLQQLSDPGEPLSGSTD